MPEFGFPSQPRNHMMSLLIADLRSRSDSARIESVTGRFEDMLEQARWVMVADPKDPRLLRFGIQAGVWGGDAALANEAYEKLKEAEPLQAQAAKRFIDRPPPRPRRR